MLCLRGKQDVTRVESCVRIGNLPQSAASIKCQLKTFIENDRVKEGGKAQEEI